MRIVSIFFWIIIGAIILWFFKLNLDQSVDIHLIYTQFYGVNLATVIFLSVFVGVIIGSVFIVTQYFKAKTEVAGLRKEIKNLQQKIEKNVVSPSFTPDLPLDNVIEKNEE